jgi:putative ABC transport system permease protein
LKPGIALDQARANMEAIAQRIGAASPQTNQGWGVIVQPLKQAVVGDDLHVMAILLTALVAFVLTTVCANVGNLLLARGIGRTREIAVRAALGGSRARIMRHLLVESLVLATAGGLCGWIVAAALVTAAPAVMPPQTLPQSIVMLVDARLAVFATVVTIATGVVFGIAPAWHAARVPTADALASGGRTSTAAASGFRSLLTTIEIAVAVVLVSGATLLARTIVSLRAVDGGFVADNLLTMYVSPSLTRYPTPEHALRFYQEARRQIASLPGVHGVAIGGSLPLDGWDIGQGFDIVGAPRVESARRAAAHYQIVGAQYFDILGIRVLRGRAFDDRDDARSTPVCIVNEEFARRYFSDRDPIGARVAVSAMDPAGPRSVVREIVGVSHQVKVESLGEKENAIEIYVPVLQNPWYGASIAVKTDGPPTALVAAVRSAVARADKDLPIARVRTMDEVMAESIAEPKFRAELAGMFALLALVLAAAGVFGVLAFTVNRRLREFGIRLALGARPLDVAALVAQSALRITAVGAIAGLIAAAALTRFLAALLFGVRPLDPLTLVAAPALLVVVALAACVAPALRAVRVDPAVSLRVE